jgi:hypothetical protein
VQRHLQAAAAPQAVHGCWGLCQSCCQSWGWCWLVHQRLAACCCCDCLHQQQR